MKSSSLTLCFLSMLFFFNCTTEDTQPLIEQEAIYFPPINSEMWDTKSMSELGWNVTNSQALLDFLEEKNTKGFIMLHNGKIVIESYMNGHTESSSWYWASAGKTLTTTVTGIAQDQGILDINDKVSDYIGTGWTSIPLEKENLITNKNLLSMTSGLDDTLGEDISAENLQYLADAGDRWAYHGVFLKLQDVVASASNQTWNNYFNTNLKDRIGMTQIVSQNFLNEATNTSQSINLAYGYLWWLNGKSSYHLPQSQLEFDGELIPNAPSDMYCALGKNDQKIYIVPSKNIVVIRMGEAAEGVNFALSNFDNELWEKINLVIN